jgi:hypothetical protein
VDESDSTRMARHVLLRAYVARWQVAMNAGALVLIVLLVLLFFGGFPSWGFHSYGWGPSGGIGTVLLILLLVLLLR